MTVVYALQRALVVFHCGDSPGRGLEGQIQFTNSDLQKFIFLLSADQIISVPLTKTMVVTNSVGSITEHGHHWMTFNLQYSHPHFLLSDHCRPMLCDSETAVQD